MHARDAKRWCTVGAVVVHLCIGGSPAGWIDRYVSAGSVAAAAESRSPKEVFAESLQRSRSLSTPEQQREFVLAALGELDQVLKQFDLSTAIRLSTLAAEVATKSRHRHLVFLAKSRRDDLLSVAREFKDLAKNLEKLSKSPDDPEASFYVGRFACAIAHDWEGGLRLLSRGSDPGYREAARAEMAGTGDRQAQFAAAARWAALANVEQLMPLRFSLSQRACQLYGKAMEGAPDAQRAAISRAMNETLPVAYLSEMQESGVKAGPWALGKHGTLGDPQRRPIEIGGIPVANGLGLHPPDAGGHASVQYQLNGSWEVLSFGVGFADTAHSISSAVVFSVLGDGKVLWKSRPVKSRGDADHFRVSVKSVETLELRTECAGSHIGAHAVWVDPYVSK